MALLQDVDDPLVGRTVRAALPLRAGQLVIAESPLITVSGMYAVDDRTLRRLYRAGAALLRCGLIPFLNVHAFVHASKAVQDRILEHFCSYEVHTPLGTLPWDEPPERRSDLPKLVRLAMRVSEWCCANIPCCASLTPDVLTRAQCCFALNSHSLSGWLPSDPALLAEHALFEQGSRLTHSCGSSANTIYHCVDGLAEHRATRHIGVGEVITTSYLPDRGGLGAAIAGTRDRQQHLLEGYLFRCACARCTAPDQSRRFPCCVVCNVAGNNGDATAAAAAARHPVSGMLPLPSVEVKLRWNVNTGKKDIFTGVRDGCEEVSTCTSTLRWAQDVCQRAAIAWPMQYMQGYSTLNSDYTDQQQPEGQPHDKVQHDQWRCDRCSRLRDNDEVNVSIQVPAEMLCYGCGSAASAGGSTADLRSLFDWEQALISLVNAPLPADVKSRSVGSSCCEIAVAEIFGPVDELVSLLELCLRVLGPEHWATATVRERILDAILEAFEDESDGESDDRSHIRAACFGPDLLLSAIAVIRVQFVELWRWFEGHGVCAAWTGLVLDLLRACRCCPALLLAQSLTPSVQDAPKSWLDLNLEEVVGITIRRTELEYGIDSKEVAMLKGLSSVLNQEAFS